MKQHTSSRKIIGSIFHALSTIFLRLWIVIYVAINVTLASQQLVTSYNFTINEAAPIGTFIGQLQGENGNQLSSTAASDLTMTATNIADWSQWFDKQQLNFNGRIVTSRKLNRSMHSTFDLHIYDSANQAYQVKVLRLHSFSTYF